MFPREAKEAYYLVTKNCHKTVYSGRLYTKYKNHRQFLIKESKRKTTAEDKTNDLPQLTPDDENRLRWLKHNVIPWATVVEMWEQTSKLRSYKNTTETISQIVQTCPALKQPTGFLLVSFLDIDY
jgi:hypothetical protein